ncbi:MAG TPA: tetratricopeptide repeat protein [Candidatus Kapabacteria bacterium]|jgi:signal transduction histidine kinase|nr:tetratricopeptide repeat protein [Candidatus Kapabacteria bacterium]
MVGNAQPDASTDPRPDVEELLNRAWAAASGSSARAEELIAEARSVGPWESRFDALVAVIRTFGESRKGYTSPSEPRVLEMIDTLDPASLWYARALSALSVCDHARSDFEAALDKEERCLAIQTALGSRAGMASALNNLARTHSAMGDRELALERYTESLAIRGELDDRVGMATTLANLAYVHASSGAIDRAIEHAEQSLRLRRELGDRSGEANALEVLGNIHQSVGRYIEARDVHQKCLAIRSEIGERSGIASSLNNLGIAQSNIGDYAEALECMSAALDIQTALGNRSSVASALSNIGVIHQQLGNYSKSLESFEGALEIEKSIGDRGSVAGSLTNIGLVHHALGDLARAQEHFEEAYEIHLALGHHRAASLAINNIGKLCFELGDFEEALVHHRRSLDLAREVAASDRIAAALGGLGRALVALGRFDGVLDLYRQSLDIRSRTGDRKGVSETLHLIAHLQHAMGLHCAAAATLERSLDLALSLGIPSGILAGHQALASLLRDVGLHEGAYEHLTEYYRVKAEHDDQATRRRLLTEEVSRQLELARKQAEIEQLRNVELADANARLQEAHDSLANALADLKSTQSQLVLAERMSSIGQLTAGIAHEINNPINFIRASSQPLRRDLDEIRTAVADVIAGLPDDLRDAAEAELRRRDVDELRDEIDALLKGIEEGATRTSEIVKGLRTFTRLDENDVKRVDLHDGLDATLALLSPRLGGRLSVVREYGEAPDVECSPGQINQVFMNILTNAIDACDGVGTITVRTARDADRVVVSIADTGCGMDTECLAKIFEPFFTTKPVGAGQGLGLSIAYAIVQRHGGSLTVESTPGVGTAATMRLPIAAAYSA